MSDRTSASPAGRGADAPLLQIRDLDVTFTTAQGPVPAVRGVDLTVYPGQTVAIVGGSGSGKSTTAHAVIGLLPGTGAVTGGSITFDGRDLTRAGRREMVAIRGTQIGLVPQDPTSNLNPVWTIGHQVREALTANGIARGAAADARVVELLAEAGLPDAGRRAAQYPHELSGGMRQRVLIAMGLAGRPRLLIADEPTSALDVTVQRAILDHLQGLTQRLGTALLLVTHDLGLAAERAEHLVVMHRGQVVESGPARGILAAPQHPYTRRLVASAPSLASRRVRSAERRRPASARPPAVTPVVGVGPARDRVLEVDHLTKVFPLRGGRPGAPRELTAVDDVSFSVRRGTTMALVGESGSGKSTVANAVLALLAPTSGTVRFDGTDLSGLGAKELLAFRRRVQPIFQNPYGSLDPMYSVHRTLEEPLRVHRIGDRGSRRRRVRELLDMVALPAATSRRYPHELSGGQRQRVAIARALALEPEVVVCDEAVSALDVLVQAQVLTLLADLQAQLGLSYLFITHDLAVVRQIADEVCVMRAGRVVEVAAADAVFDHPREAYTRELLAAIPGAGLDRAEAREALTA